MKAERVNFGLLRGGAFKWERAPLLKRKSAAPGREPARILRHTMKYKFSWTNGGIVDIISLAKKWARFKFICAPAVR